MDIDLPQHTRNSPFITFFDVSNNFPWQTPRPEQIRQRRVAMLDSLIFDILLMSGGVREPYLVYPPEDSEGLERLLEVIEGTTYDALKKDCLVYFLLKWHQDGRERNFQQQRCIPPQFTALADAYWHLDTGINVPRAVAILSDARLNRDYASKIILAISISTDAAPLIRRYVQTAKPILVDPPELERYTLALADSSILEAWQYARTFNDSHEMRPRLFKKIVEWAVSPKPRPNALTQLLALPLSEHEESLLIDFVQKPPPSLQFKAVAIIQDLICVRLIQGGRYNEAIKKDRLFTSTTSPKHLKETSDRTKMIQDVYAALPSVERALVDLELDPSAYGKPHLVPKPAFTKAMAEVQPTPLSQSWEDVRMPDSMVNKSTPLREVRIPSTMTPLSMSRLGSSALHNSTPTPIAAPILPVNFDNVASGSKATPKKSMPLAASILGSSNFKPRSSLSGVGNRMAFGASPAISSPASGMKFPMAGTSSPHGPVNTFVSAGRQQNAFYQPPPLKTNGVKRPFEDDMSRSPERAPQASNDVDMHTETEKADVLMDKSNSRPSRKSTITEEEEDEDRTALQYSVFSGRKERSSPQASSKRGPFKAPPGSYASEEEDAMDDDEDNSRRKPTRTSTRPATSAASKPPAKKARQVKEPELGRSLPGTLMADDEEEEDHVAPLRAPSPPRRGARKARSSVSMEMADDGEGVQTRRRSSRLTTTGSAHGGSPEPPVKKAKKSTRTGGTKKKR
ncbi:nuclear pore complex assembly-domain-containing protein [Crassisporium funariophilum]|nr:nuclear pore complex assembly-domain-containing protein [Crassisporium funariophilum]